MDGRPEAFRGEEERLRGKGESTLSVSPSLLAACLPEAGGWRETVLPEAGCLARFRCGRVAPGITATASRCRGGEDHAVRIEHPRPAAMLVFGESGCTAFEPAEGRRCVIRPGDVWLLHADAAPLLRRPAPGTDNRMTVLKFDAARLDGLWSEGGDGFSRAAPDAMRLGHGEAPQAWTSEIFGNPLASPLDRLLAEGQCLELLARWLGPLPSLPEMRRGVSAEDSRRIGRVVEMLVADLAAPPSLDDLAASAGMSHVRLNRCFRKLYGTTVFGWLRDYRLDRACYCLDDPRCSVTDAAFRCGFSSSSHFATAFRRRFRCSPQEYRRRS